MTWNLYEGNKFLKPLTFSNGKSQEDIVNEILDLFNKGKRIIFIHGVCGTGKSSIALNLAKELGKSSIVVPSKSLQRQYKKDYEQEKYLLKNNGERLDIRVMTGRNNHKCQFLEDNKKRKIFSFKEEKNANLNHIFDKKTKEAGEVDSNKSADNPQIPCKIEIKEKNLKRIKEYLKQNPKVNLNKIGTIKDVKRLPLASVCPYWSPVFPKEYGIDYFKDVKKREYEGLTGEKFIFYQRKKGCSFYEQFNSYIDADVIVFNALKYKLESLMNRKPLTEVEIIDECDEFLDGFSQQRNVNLDLFENSLMYISFDKNQGKDFNEMFEILKHLKKDRRVLSAVESEEIIPLKQTGIYDLFRILLESEELFEYADEESYMFDVLETAKMFEGFLDETYVVFNKNKNNQLIASIVTTNLSKKFQELINKNKYLVLMSGTLHSEDVLRNVFGLNDFEIIEAETTQQGQIDIKQTGLEKNCKFSNFKNGKHSREEYLKALDKCVEVSEKPTVVQVNSFKDLPNKEEKNALSLKNLETLEEVKEKQSKENEAKTIHDFKSGKTKTLFSTKVSRGIDFPGSECRSIVFTKYPNPNVKDAFWKILNQTKPLEYWKFYKDKARRELLQKIYRGLRFPQDHLYLLSPDSRVLEAFE